MALVAMPAVAGAQSDACRVHTSQTSLAALSGRAIRSVRIETADPSPFPGIASMLSSLHVRTRASTLERDLLLAAGDTVDTLRVAESLRRLRQLRFIAAPEVRATDCGGPVDIVVATRDLWSTKASVQVRSNSALVGVSERNALGTGREVALALRSDRGRVGFGTTLRDPALLGGPLTADLGVNLYRDGSEWSAAFARRERRVLDRWSFGAGIARSTRDAASLVEAGGDSFRRTDLGVLVGRRLGEVAEAADAATSLQWGVELEEAALLTGAAQLRLGPSQVERRVLALDVGVARRSVGYDTLTWLLPNSAIVDVPRAFEYDALVGLGHDAISGAPVAHLDAWAGQMWAPSRGALLLADAWMSGFRSPGSWTAGTLRGSLAYHRAAPRGLWSARVGGEWLFEPDPDVRAMVAVDPTVGALPSEGRMAEAVVAGSLEREVRLRPLSRSWSLAGAAFVAASTRWDPMVATSLPPSPLAVAPGRVEGGKLGVGVVGFGLRLLPTRLGRSTARLDVGFPVLRSTGVPSRPYLSIGISPWLEDGRQRDGRHGQ